MRWSGIALIALLAGTGCSFRSALEDFCEETGECACPDGNCCSLYKQTCGGIGCCAGMFCNPDGFCERNFEPKLVIPAVGNTYFDLPAVEPGQSTGPTVLEILNDGAGPTTELQVKFDGSSRITADVSGCAGRILNAGESCQVVLTGRPDAYAEYNASLEVKELGRLASALIRATGGAAVEVVATWQAPVSSTPEGIDCPGTCTHFFPVGTSVKLSPTGNFFWGTHGVLQATRVTDGFCDQTSRTCDVVANSRVIVNSIAQPNLKVSVQGTGAVTATYTNVSGQSATLNCTGTATGGCLVQFQGPFTLKVANGNRLSWTGPCEGQGDTCNFNVPSGMPTHVEARFQ